MRTYRIVSIRSITRSDHQSIHRRERTFVARAISEIPELSHGIQDRRPRHSKHPSLLAMPTVFSCVSIILVGRFPELTPVRSQTTSHGFLPWMLVTMQAFLRSMMTTKQAKFKKHILGGEDKPRTRTPTIPLSRETSPHTN